MSTSPPGPRLRLPGGAAASSRRAHLDDRFDVRRLPGGTERRLVDGEAGFFGGGRRRKDDPGFAQCLALPKLSLPFGKVAAELGERNGQRATLAGRPQPRIDLVEPAERAELGGDFDDPLPQLAEKMLVRGRIVAFGPAASAPSCRRLRRGRPGPDRCSN